MEESSDSDSASDSDSSVKQEIRRSKPREKPSSKKRAVDKYLRTKKPHIETNTGKWIRGYPYYCQDQKGELSEGPYGSDINYYEEEWTTGQHELNGMDISIDEIISESNNNYKRINYIPK